MPKKVLVFGVFDGVHEGHRALFRQAKSYGDYLIVAAAHDLIVQNLKGHAPRKPLDTRLAELADEDLVNAAVAGDAELGTYDVIRINEPAVIVVGYDQRALKDDLEKHLPAFDWPIAIIVAEPHKPEQYHSSLNL